jgi:hypothetical protein
MCEWWDYSRGFSIKGATHKIDLKFTRKDRGLFAKRPYILPPWVWARTVHAQRTGTEELAPDAANPQGSGRVGARVRCKTERGDRGDRKDVLTIDGDGRMWPDLKVNGGAAVRLGQGASSAGRFRRRRRRCRAAARRLAGARAGAHSKGQRLLLWGRARGRQPALAAAAMAARPRWAPARA